MAPRSGFAKVSRLAMPGRYVGTSATATASRSRRNINLLTSEWVESLLYIKDGDTGKVHHLDFSERRYIRRLYDTPARKVIFMTSRQTEKSTTLGNRLLAMLGGRRNYTTVFVTPSAMQTMVFSRARIDDIIDMSPTVAALRDAQRFNILEKTFKNGSRAYLRYAFLNADRIRGIAANSLFCDEIQDLLPDVMPVIEEVTSHQQDPFFLYSGTPKTFDNTIEKYWSAHSTQSEWVIPCERHGLPKDASSWHWNILDMPNIGKLGPVCSKCKQPIFPEHPKAQWVAMRPKAEFEGLRICRLMVPWVAKSPKRWADMLYDRERYPLDRFMNEVLARSYDGGTKPLSRAEIMRACDTAYPNSLDTAMAQRDKCQLYAGLDWGTGSETSYTVLTIGGYCRNDTAFQILYTYRFTGPLADPTVQMVEIMKVLNQLRIRLIGTDYGMGFHPNKILTNAYGAAKVLQYQYQARLTGKLVYKPALHRYLAFRTPLMADAINALKAGNKIRLPEYESFKEPYAEDYLSLRAEYSQTLRMIQYTKARSATDDSFHSMLYCFLAACRDRPRPDVFLPTRDLSTDDARAAAAEEAAIQELYNRAAEHGIDM